MVSGFVWAGVVVAMASGWACAQSMTSEQDHQRTLKLLGIDKLRGGADGMNPQAPNAANRDESKAGHKSPLPDPLFMNDGSRVTTPQQWWQSRRPELVELFDREIYGRMPASVPGVTWSVAATSQSEIGGVAAITKTLVGRVDNSGFPAIEVNIQATLVTPANASRPVPVIVDFGFGRRPATQPATQPARTPEWQKMLLETGWGYAILNPTSVQADNGAGLTKGIIGLTNKGEPRKVDDWGALRAWAWGASRLIDYLETDAAVDAKRLGIEGLSRYGKATAVTMAYEPRFAIAFVGSSGQGGMKIMRRNFGEQVENVAASGEYHWMAGNYLKYAGPLTPDDLPIDAHELVALCAPRPVFISVGSLNVEGIWIDANGNFLAGKHAAGVYELLGKKGLSVDAIPAENVGAIEGDIAFRMHDGGHTTGPNWPSFITFASRYFEK